MFLLDGQKYCYVQVKLPTTNLEIALDKKIVEIPVYHLKRLSRKCFTIKGIFHSGLKR